MAKKKETEHTQEPTDPRFEKIAQKLKDLRVKAGYTSHENFAWDNDISRVQYWRIEKGKNITLETLFKVLDIHKITLEEFFKGL